MLARYALSLGIHSVKKRAFLIIKNHLKNHVNKEYIVKALPLKSFNSIAILLSVAFLAGCNQNDHDVQTDKTKPIISVANPLLVMGVVLDSTKPVNFIIADKSRINASDNSGSVSLSVVDVVGLSKAQVSLATDGTLTASNILATTAIGRGYVVVRATDSSGNYTDNKIYFDISPVTASTQANVTVGQSLTLHFSVMANSQQTSVTLPTNPAGVSAVANLAGNELSVTFNTNNSAVASELKPKISVKTATGEVYSFVLTINVQEAVSVDNTPPSKVSENLPWIDAAGATNATGTITLNEAIASVSDVKFVDAVTGVTLTGGAASTKVSAVNPMVINVEYSIPAFGSSGWSRHQLVFTAVDKAGNSALIESDIYGVN